MFCISQADKLKAIHGPRARSKGCRASSAARRSASCSGCGCSAQVEQRNLDTDRGWVNDLHDLIASIGK